MMKQFNWRSFVSFSLAFSFLAITITGIVLFLTPSGRVAHWTSWKLLGLLKEEWQAIHMLFSILFVILSIFHLFFINWKAFKHYIKKRSANRFNKLNEFILATLIAILFLIGTLAKWEPFNTIIAYSEYLTESWEHIETAPPIPHAEKFTLSELAEKVPSSNLDEMKNRLAKHQIKFTETQTLLQIATSNNKTPNEIYRLSTTKPLTGGQGKGMGIGRLTLKDLELKIGITSNQMDSLLKSNSIDFSRNMLFKDIALKNNMSPMDLMSLIEETKDL